MRLLVTRPQPDADDLAATLRQMGHEAVVSPLLEIVCRALPAPEPGRFAGLVATSRNALACLGTSGDFEALRPLPPLVAVGPATARMARELGFAEVLEGPGRASDLVAVILERFGAAENRTLYHAAAAEKAFDLAEPLAERGITLVSEIVYDARDAAAFTPQALAALDAGLLEGVILMSPRTARVFARLLNEAGLTERLPGLSCLCLSDKVAAAIADLPCADKRIAGEPNLAALIDLLDPPAGPVAAP